MEVTSKKPVQATRRALVQSAQQAIRDVYDAVVELVTNADDRYQVLGTPGIVEIEAQRRRGDTRQMIRVRDFADGMDSETMDRKIGLIGGRESGLAEGLEVRGTHSRGAKDIAALGHVTFESIAGDGEYHKCEITPYFDFILYPPLAVNEKIRSSLGVPAGTGTLVTIELEKNVSVPRHDQFVDNIRRLVSLRKVLRDPNRTVMLCDLGKGEKQELRPPVIEGKERLAETLTIPGYPGVSAKLVICRSAARFEKETQRFRLGGILVESKRAVHDATLFDPGLEANPHALVFYGRLVCPYIDDLCNDFDERFEAQTPRTKENPIYVLDSSRRSGLSREHPFVKALAGEVLKRLRPLVQEEERLAEHERSVIETAATRKRLNALERAAMEYMEQFESEDDVALDPDGKAPESGFMQRGYALSPPFCQMVVGHSAKFWLTIRQDIYPELEVGSRVQVECLSDDIECSKRFCSLEQHPTREGVLRAVWTVRALHAEPCTGIHVVVGSIAEDSQVEVVNSEADLYSHVTDLMFSKSHFGVRTDQKKKKVSILAPIKSAPHPTELRLSVDSPHFQLSGQQLLQPIPALGIARCELTLKSDGTATTATLRAALGDSVALSTVTSHKPLGAELSIKIEDIDLKNQRYRWRQNVLQIAARHPSLRRYLGPERGPAGERFPGQEEPHFRVLIAEIVSDAVCARLVGRDDKADKTATPEKRKFEDADWDTYYAEYSIRMTEFLPRAHEIQYRVD